MHEYQISAIWDEEAKVWTATSEDVLGLCFEAETLEGLIDEARALIPELLALNGQLPKGRDSPIPFRVTAERAATTRIQ
jgi:predicted RNase H-like HicB family nuclease